MMINFKNDYSSIAHPQILNALSKYNDKTYVGYGLDEITEEAKKKIKEHIGNLNVDIHFLAGGTITNKVFIAHSLKPYEAVISADTGHINTHETGAIEQTGHKVIPTISKGGKVIPSAIEKLCLSHTDEHMVKPKMLYISNTTEYGSVYTFAELKELSALCKRLGLYFYLDGARLGAALTSDACDYTIQDIAALVDAFYIGGTKNGLMMGEALVIVNEDLKSEFRYSIKHYGGMIAKGFLLGIEFLELFKDNLFYEIARKQNNLAKVLEEELKKLNVEFFLTRESNQLFPIFLNEIVEQLSKHILFEIWERSDDHTVVRFVTHLATTTDDINNAVKIIKEVLKKEMN